MCPSKWIWDGDATDRSQIGYAISIGKDFYQHNCVFPSISCSVFTTLNMFTNIYTVTNISHYAEQSGYWKSTNFLDQVREQAQNGEEITFYDSNTGNALFVAPRGRSFEEFVKESTSHGWPSFRDDEVGFFYYSFFVLRVKSAINFGKVRAWLRSSLYTYTLF